MKFYFQSEDSDGNTRVAHEFECGTWYESLDQFVKFLRGSGYQVQDNSIGINEAVGHLFLDELELNNITQFDQVKD